MSATRLTYVFDAYCGWCLGFGPAVRELAATRKGEVELEVVSGGLFRGPHRSPLREMPYVAEANRRIEQLTGARFGEGYLSLVADGTFVMDSDAAAVGFAALRAEAPDRALELAGAMQHAFYVDGLSLSEPETYRALARAAGLEAGAVLARLRSAETRAAAVAGFARARELGVTSYPTLLAHTATGVARLGGPTSTAAQLGAALDEHRRAATVTATRSA
jgi:putative protein-disulfide isomerase